MSKTDNIVSKCVEIWNAITSLKHAGLRGCLIGFVLLNISSCFVMENKYSALPPGVWRAVLQLTPREMVANSSQKIHSARQFFTQKEKSELKPIKMEEATEGELPFLFEVKYSNENTFTIDIINGEERITVPAEDIKIGRDKATAKDTVLINFPVFGSYIRAVFQERVMEGEFINAAKKLVLPFSARYAENHRFTTIKKQPIADLTGQWECNFDISSEKPYKAIGEFKQNGNILRGTFRTETGDYRFLDGEVQANKLYLSCFDGAHNFLFEGKISPEGTILGIFRSSRTGEELWEAKRNPNFELRNAESLTTLKNANSGINFSFPNAQGKNISLNDYTGKVKIIQIMGTWCPNCRDETKFLTEYVKNNPSDKLAPIALAFERNADVAKNQLITYKEKMNVPYEILLAGTSTNKDEATKALPWLNQIIAFPTMIFVDKKNTVRKIHTGFEGPASSKHAAFTKEFDEFVKKLLAE
jgi:thiol-disulfide isomerase/thioredoxin